MVLFKDDRDNEYFIEDDYLYVTLVKLGVMRKIGKLSYNLVTKKSSLLVFRKSTEKYKLGYMISAAVFEHFDISKVTLIEDNRTIYVLDWDAVKEHRKAWTFKPTNGFEDQYLIPDAHFSLIKTDTVLV